MSRAPSFIVAVTVVAGAGCTTRNALYCDAETPCTDFELPICNTEKYRCEADPLRVPCGPGGTCDGADRPVCYDGFCVECGVDLDCGFAAPVCGAQHYCSGCAAAAECDRFGDRPFCEAGACAGCRSLDDCDDGAGICDEETLECRGCVENAECPSAVCDTDAAECVAPGDILYVSVDGDDDAGCTADNPCATVQRAIDLAADPRVWVSVGAGVFSGPVTIPAIDVRIIGAAAADTILTSTVADTPIVTVNLGGHPLLRDLTLRGAVGASGLDCTPSADGTTSVRIESARLSENDVSGAYADRCDLTLADVDAEDNGEHGVHIARGALSVEGGSFSRNTQRGIYVDPMAAADAGSVIVRGSLLEQNMDGGIRVLYSSADVTGCVARKNGGSGIYAQDAEIVIANNFSVENEIYGLSLSDPGGESAGRYEFNTLVNNVMSDVFCGSGTIYVGTNNIAPSVGGVCSDLTYSIGPAPGDGEGNLGGVTPLFVDADGGDYHLLPDSPGVDDGGPTTITTDHDGDDRPQGDGVDMGADEVVP